jgi:hypothetical protein
VTWAAKLRDSITSTESGIEIDFNCDKLNINVVIVFNCEFDSNKRGEPKMVAWSALSPIKLHDDGIVIEPIDDDMNANDSIRFNCEFGPNSIRSNDLTCAKLRDPITSTESGIEIDFNCDDSNIDVVIDFNCESDPNKGGEPKIVAWNALSPIKLHVDGIVIEPIDDDMNANDSIRFNCEFGLNSILSNDFISAKLRDSITSTESGTEIDRSPDDLNASAGRVFKQELPAKETVDKETADWNILPPRYLHDDGIVKKVIEEPENAPGSIRCNFDVGVNSIVFSDRVFEKLFCPITSTESGSESDCSPEEWKAESAMVFKHECFWKETVEREMALPKAHDPIYSHDDGMTMDAIDE